MELVSKLLCEKELPIPSENFSEEEKEIFSDFKWDEQEFFTSSFLDYDAAPNVMSVYTITDDGQFYKNLIEIEFEENDEKEIVPVEKDRGIEKQDFTGKILFGTIVLGEEHDYDISFDALFYKGELKELEENEWIKKSNKERKRLLKNMQQELNEANKKKNQVRHTFVLCFLWVLLQIVNFVKWILFTIFRVVVRVEAWIRK